MTLATFTRTNLFWTRLQLKHCVSGLLSGVTGLLLVNRHIHKHCQRHNRPKGCKSTMTNFLKITIKVAPDESLCSGTYAPVLPANQFNTKKFSLTITRWNVDVDHGVDVDVDDEVDVDANVDVDVDVNVAIQFNCKKFSPTVPRWDTRPFFFLLVRQKLRFVNWQS